MDKPDYQLTDSGLQGDVFESFSEAINSGKKLEKVLDLIVQRARELLLVSNAFIFLREGADLELKAASDGLPQERVILPTHQTIESWVIKHGRIIAVFDPQSNSRYKDLDFYGKASASNDQEEDSNPVGIVAAPIRVGLQIVGVFSIIDKPQPAAEQVVARGISSPGELRELVPFLAVLADLVSLALENNQLLKVQQRRTQLIELIRIISRNLDDNSVEELAQTVCGLICEATKAENCQVMLHSKETDEFVVLGKSSTPLSLLDQQLGLDHIPLATSGLLLSIYQKGEPFLAGRLPKGDELPFLEKTGIQSVLVMPLEVEQERLGFLILASTKVDAFNEDDLNFVSFISIRLGYSLHQKELSEELALAEKSRIKLDEQENQINTVAHDLKNTLAAIKGNSQLSIRRFKRGDTAFSEKAMQIITSKADQAIRLVEEMVEINQLERGSFRLLVAAVDLVSLVQEEIEAIEEITTTHNFEFETSFTEIELIADKNRLAQVINNLLVNAVRYSPADTTIRVTISAPPEPEQKTGLPDTPVAEPLQSVMVSVADEGAGVSALDQSHIFERFYRGQGALLSSGSGLGLYICREIITLHAGKLWVDTQEGQGASFHFTLPCNRLAT